MISWSYLVETPPASVGAEPSIASLQSEAVAPKDFAIDLDTGDLAIPMRLVSGSDAVAQRLWIRLGYMLGENFLDTREGIPYLQSVFVTNPDVQMIDLLFSRVVDSTPGVAALLSYTSTFDKRTRTYSAAFRAQCVTGDVLSFKSKPFIVPVGG